MLRSIFGPSKDEIWSQMAKDIGGEYIDAGFWSTDDALKYRHGEWEILLDTSSAGDSMSTRMRTTFLNSDGLRFQIYRGGLFSFVDELFNVGGFEIGQDIEIGDPFFDDQFIIKGNNESKIKLLLNDATLKQLIQNQPQIFFEIKDDMADGTAMLCFECGGIIMEASQLRALFELFTVTLVRLVQIDSAYESDPAMPPILKDPALPPILNDPNIPPKIQ